VDKGSYVGSTAYQIFFLVCLFTIFLHVRPSGTIICMLSAEAEVWMRGCAALSVPQY